MSSAYVCETDPLYEILEPNFGHNFTSASLTYLNEHYDDFASPKVKNKFAELLKNPPEDKCLSGKYSVKDKQFVMLSAALKFAGIKDFLAKEQDGFEYKEIYNNFDRAIVALPEFKKIADNMDADLDLLSNEDLLNKSGKSPDDIVERMSGKDGNARIIFYNDIELQKDIGNKTVSDIIKAITESVGGIEGVKRFQEIFLDIAELSAEKGKSVVEKGKNMPDLLRPAVAVDRRNRFWDNMDRENNVDLSKVKEM